jgi:serine/threonine protein kinase
MEAGAPMHDPDLTPPTTRPYQTVADRDAPKQEARSPILPAISGYELLEVVGIGGMGIVYKARQTSLKRLVALKMIKEGHYAEPRQLARFRKEAEAVARLQHPNIVHIYDFGDYQHQPYFTMEFVDGGNLVRKIKERGSFSPEEAAVLVELLARAMQHAHVRGILHRDLNPRNIVLTGDGIPKITDFGLAKRLDGGQGSTTGGGTLQYMAPEQAGGDPGQIGPEVDVYALGGILYELLCGRPAFQGPNIADILDKVRLRPPTPPRSLNPEISLGLQTICLKCLEKQPQQRYFSAEALADDLLNFLRGKPITAGLEDSALSNPLTKRLSKLLLPVKREETGTQSWAAAAGFEITRLLGSRSPGLQRFLARSVTLNRPVALKVILPEADEQTRRDFTHEAAVVARLHHPNIPEFLGRGEQEGYRYLVFEYVDGSPLNGVLATTKLEVHQSVRIMAAVARALDHAHEEGVVHRDLRPRNILLGVTGVVKIKDLGLPRPPRDPAGATPSSTDALGYRAPEQLADEVRMDPLMNIYSLGAIFYEMLTGKRLSLGARPVPKEASRTGSGWEPPSSRRPGVSAALDAICFRCLQWDPRDRYPTAEALANDLARALPVLEKK